MGSLAAEVDARCVKGAGREMLMLDTTAMNWSYYALSSLGGGKAHRFRTREERDEWVECCDGHAVGAAYVVGNSMPFVDALKNKGGGLELGWGSDDEAIDAIASTMIQAEVEKRWRGEGWYHVCWDYLNSKAVGNRWGPNRYTEEKELMELVANVWVSNLVSCNGKVEGGRMPNITYMGSKPRPSYKEYNKEYENEYRKRLQAVYRQNA